MHFNIFKSSIRSLFKEATYSMINVFGLSSAFTIALFIFSYAHYEFSYEKMYEKSNRIVRVTTDLLDNETVIEQDCEVYPPLPQRIVDDIPSAISFARTYQLEDTRTFEIENEYHTETKAYAIDQSYFELFNQAFITPKPDVFFDEPHQVILSESTALRMYRTTDIVGKTLKVPEIESPFTVIGVVEDSPSNTHLKIGMYVSYPTMLASFGERNDNWSGNNTYAYILLSDDKQHENFYSSLIQLNTTLKKEEKINNEKFIAEPIRDIHLLSNKSFEPEINGDLSSVQFLLVVAGLVLIIAYVNYINLSTSKALDRAKEIGMRKVLGATQTQVRMQILVESTIIYVISGAICLLLVFLLMGPFINISGLPSSFNPFSSIQFWMAILSITIVGGLLSGIVPALILSSFSPQQVLKGKFGHSSIGSKLRKSLVVFQFAVTILLLIQTLTIKDQLHHMQEMDLGANIEKVITVRGPDADSLKNNLSAFKNELKAQAWIQDVSLSSAVPGVPVYEMSTTTGINLSDATVKSSFNYYLYQIDENYIPAMKMKFMAGNNFNRNDNNDRNVIINEETARLLGVENVSSLVNKKLTFWGTKWTIKGVLKNFHQTSPKTPFIPLVLRYSDNFNYANIRSNDTAQETYAQVQSLYEQYFPGYPFDAFFIDQAYEKQFRKDQQFESVFGALTIFAIAIACIGLYGLATFTILKRSKEIGIRKVLGAEVKQVILLLTKDFALLVLVSATIALPMSYWTINLWLNEFTHRIAIEWYLFFIPVFGVFVLAIGSVSLKTVSISLLNPVDALRDE